MVSRKTWRTRRYSWALLAGAFLVTGCGGEEGAEEVPPVAEEPVADETAPPPAAPAGATGELVQQGQALFTGSANCYTCHAASAQGTALAPDLTDDTWINIPQNPTMEDIVTVIRTGVPTPVEHPAPMPPMGGASLTDEQIQAVAAYVASL